MSQEATRSAAPTTQRNSLRWLALAGVVGPVIWWVLIIVNGALTPGYSHVSQFLSELGAVNAPYGIIQQVNFLVLGVSVLALVVGLDRWNRGGWLHWLAVVLLGVFGLAILTTSLFPMNPANPGSVTDRYHDLLGRVAFFAILVGIPIMTWRLSNDEQWPGYRHWVTVVGTAILVVGGFVVFIMSTDTGWVGLGQRIYAGVFTVWVAYISFRLYQLATGEVQVT